MSLMNAERVSNCLRRLMALSGWTDKPYQTNMDFGPNVASKAAQIAGEAVPAMLRINASLAAAEALAEAAEDAKRMASGGVLRRLANALAAYRAATGEQE
jgi:hypothetical protein